MAKLVFICIMLALIGCGGEPSFKEGEYAIEVDCYFNELGPNFRSVLHAKFDRYGKYWRIHGLDVVGIPKNGRLYMESALGCGVSPRYLVVDILPTEEGFQGVGYTKECEGDVILQEKGLVGVLIK